jgi:hypothetical protein
MSQPQTTKFSTVLKEESAIVGVDLGKTVFQLCIADNHWRVVDAKRLSRLQFEHFFVNRNVSLVVMEACATAHHWARWLQGLGIQVQLIPAQYVRAYVRRNKTDAADAAALLEAARCADIRPVRVKSVEQQALQTLRRTRAIWVPTRTPGSTHCAASAASSASPSRKAPAAGSISSPRSSPTRSRRCLSCCAVP